MYIWSAVYSDALVCIRFPCGRITIIRCPIRSGSAARATALHRAHSGPHRRHTHSPHCSPPEGGGARFGVRTCGERRWGACAGALLGRPGAAPREKSKPSRSASAFLATVKPAAGYEHVTFRSVIGLTWFFQRFFQFFGSTHGSLPEPAASLSPVVPRCSMRCAPTGPGTRRPL